MGSPTVAVDREMDGREVSCGDGESCCGMARRVDGCCSLVLEKNWASRLPRDWEGLRSPVFSVRGMLEVLEKGLEIFRGISRDVKLRVVVLGRDHSWLCVHLELVVS